MRPFNSVLPALFLLATTLPLASQCASTSTSTSTAPSSTSEGQQPSDSQCASAGGACVDTGSCSKQKGTAVSGLCPSFGSSVKCCFYTPTAQKCAQLSDDVIGCVNTEYCDAKGGNYRSGLCPGPAEVRCCIGPRGNSESFALPSTIASTRLPASANATGVLSSGSRNSTASATSSAAAESTTVEDSTTTTSTSTTTTRSTTAQASGSQSQAPASTGAAWRVGENVRGAGGIWEVVLAGVVGLLV